MGSTDLNNIQVVNRLLAVGACISWSLCGDKSASAGVSVNGILEQECWCM